ncbi:hypothetical protein CEXT_659171 [Caerostris extrusa]|uniref:Uncharacterized protein n=1 Tax=Caerostris extrusa TaxID=172846 RepID=A0AAV4REG1_CAEEX|nr:hypothetical protein CEXT_659171 [Caerostris extrusa]
MGIEYHNQKIASYSIFCGLTLVVFEQHSGTLSEQWKWAVRPADVPTSENTEAGAFLACSSSAVGHHAEDRGQRGGFFRPAHTFHIHFQVPFISPSTSLSNIHSRCTFVFKNTNDHKEG